MVYFVCSTCGTCLKKNQVTTHWFKCRRGKNVSCMDCGKDFWGEEYASHVKCISEDQKYGGSNYVSKENKGEKKQEEWVINIQEKVANSQNMDPQLRRLLQNIITYSNIPRKEAKFRNFMKSSFKMYNTNLVDKVWEIFKDANSKKDNIASTNAAKNGVTEVNVATMNGTKNGMTEISSSDKKNSGENIQETHNETNINGSNDTAKLNKRERKELRKEKQNKKSKKDKHAKRTKIELNEETEPNLETAEPKKKKKRKKGDDSLVEEQQASEAVEPKKKKKKGNDMQNESFPISNENHIIQDENNEQAQPQATPVFKWTVAIKRVLQDAPEEGLKVSKLQRKVFALYYAAHGDVRSKAELIPILHKKLNKKNQFVMFKDKVKLQKL